jgi:hypothetical protein
MKSQTTEYSVNICQRLHKTDFIRALSHSEPGNRSVGHYRPLVGCLYRPASPFPPSEDPLRPAHLDAEIDLELVLDHRTNTAAFPALLSDQGRDRSRHLFSSARALRTCRDFASNHSTVFLIWNRSLFSAFGIGKTGIRSSSSLISALRLCLDGILRYCLGLTFCGDCVRGALFSIGD